VLGGGGDTRGGFESTPFGTIEILKGFSASSGVSFLVNTTRVAEKWLADNKGTEIGTFTARYLNRYGGAQFPMANAGSDGKTLSSRSGYLISGTSECVNCGRCHPQD
jgi:hypothetical protein